MPETQIIHVKSKSKISPEIVLENQPQNMNSKTLPKSDEEDEEDIPIKYIVKRKTKRQHFILYWGCLISTLLLSCVNVPIFMVSDIGTLTALVLIVIVFVIVFFTVNSCKLADSKGDMLKLYFLLDSITVALCTAIIGFVGLLTIILPPQPQVIPGAILLNLCFLMFAGNSKVIFAYCEYKRWQTIVFKINLFLGLLLYVVLAAYFMINSFDALPIKPEDQQNLKQYFFLYIFGLYTLYMEIFAKAGDIDGTSELQYHYQINYRGNQETLILDEENQKLEELNETQNNTGNKKH